MYPTQKSRLKLVLCSIVAIFTLMCLNVVLKQWLAIDRNVKVYSGNGQLISSILEVVKEAPVTLTKPALLEESASIKLERPTVDFKELPENYILEDIRHEYQGWNNCGPATLAMQLSYWGRTETQADIAPFVKPDPKDEHVELTEMQGYVEMLGLRAVIRPGGDAMTLKRLLVAGYPVLVETWHVRTPEDQLGHYQLVIGYNDTNQAFILSDSLLGPEHIIDYVKFDESWRVFNRVFLITYPPEHESDLIKIMGHYVESRWAYEHALAVARDELHLPLVDCTVYASCSDRITFVWFNIGTNLLALHQFAESADAYNQAYALGWPRRMLWYQFGPYEAYYRTNKFEQVVRLANEVLESGVRSEEAHYWRGRAKLAMGDFAGAQHDFEIALEYHPDWYQAIEMLKKVRGQ